MKHKPSVCIGIPHSEYLGVCYPFHVCLSRLINYSHEKGIVSRIQLLHMSSPKTAENRNAIAKRCDCDYMLQIDADMTFEEDTLERMLQRTKEHHDDCVVTGLGFMGAPPHYPALFSHKEEDGKHIWKPMYQWPDRPFTIDAMGSFGFIVPKGILNRIASPWNYSLKSNEEKHEGWFDHIFRLNTQTGESTEIRHDFAFSMRVKTFGGYILCDPSIKFGHIRPHPVAEEDWFSARPKDPNDPAFAALLKTHE